MLHTPNAGLNLVFSIFGMALQDCDAKMIKNEVKISIFLPYSQMLVTTKTLVEHSTKLVKTYSDTYSSKKLLKFGVIYYFGV